MTPDLLLQADFPAVDEARWREMATKALKGADFETALVSRTDDGIRVEPLHPRSRDPRPVSRVDKNAGWRVVQRVDDPDPARANAQALEDVEGGASGLSIVFAGAANAFGHGLPVTAEALARALDGVPLSRLDLRIDCHPASRVSAEWLVALMGRRRADPSKIHLSFGIDPAANFAHTGRMRMSIEALKASMPQSLAHFFALGVPGVLLEADGRVCHNAGATEAQELAFMMASALSHMRMFEAARQPLVYAVPHIGFATAASQDQFVTIAKLRALRRLWMRVQEVCSIEPSLATVHAETSWRMLTARDPETNILRAAIAVFAAAVGGADSIAVLPHTLAHGLPEGFARRVARNTQLVLAQEAHVGFVNDPAAGSGGIAHLTEALCDAAWDEFKTIEREGGLLESLQAGQFQARVTAARQARTARYRAGERHILGTTLYPLERERPVATLGPGRAATFEEGAVACERLAPQRLDESLGAAA
jgi:methylmalonyl-CoA mutase